MRRKRLFLLLRLGQLFGFVLGITFCRYMELGEQDVRRNPRCGNEFYRIRKIIANSEIDHNNIEPIAIPSSSRWQKKSSKHHLDKQQQIKEKRRKKPINEVVEECMKMHVENVLAFKKEMEKFLPKLRKRS
ncbi:hypothetical protein TNCV_2377601 [Trichonephila clavipes]|nr:hypothetical protein TNCV_2377601 [Trichonephila clavipes]